MITEVDTHAEAALVAAQVGREPRGPWRVAAHCVHGFPTVVVSPPVLDDGTPFPTWAWLTCPWLSDAVAAQESSRQGAVWGERLASDPGLAERMREADARLRRERAREVPAGTDPCSAVGIAGGRDPLQVKCLHAHVALSLAGIDDPVGAALLARFGAACEDARCARLGEGDDG